MIELPANDRRLLALKSDDPVIIGLLKITFPAAAGGVKRITDAGRDIDIAGDGTYQTGQGLMGSASPDGDGDVSRDRFQVIFADPDRVWRARFIGHGWTGIKIETFIAFLDDQGVTPVFHGYLGWCSSVQESMTEADGAKLTATFTGPLARLDGEAAVVTTPDNQARRDATDTCYDYVHAVTNVTDRWGK